MSIVLFDNSNRNHLFPLTYTKAIAALRFGILSIQERWALSSSQEVFIHTSNYLQNLYPSIPNERHIWVDAAIVLDDTLLASIVALAPDTCLVDEIGLVAGNLELASKDFKASLSNFKTQIKIDTIQRIKHPWEIMLWNDRFIRTDFSLVTKGRTSQPISSTVNIINAAEIFIEQGAKLEFCTLNASRGPIYIAKDAEVMEGTCIRGPFSLGENSVLKMNSRVYGATSLGPSCMGGGEIKNAVIMGHTNKAHDGYLGDAVIGEWCNIGAGATNSNVKNTAGDVKVWNFATNNYQIVSQKCGLIMGDYSRIAINTSINTGTVIGVSCNVFGAGLLPTIIDNFSWGIESGKYDFKKALYAIDNWKKLKQDFLTEQETVVLQTLYQQIH